MRNVSNCQVCQHKFNAKASKMPWKTWLFFWVKGLAANKNVQLAKNCSVLMLNLLFTLLEGAVGNDRFQSTGSNLRNV